MIHYFNPGHETAVLNGSPYYTPPANVVLMQSELSFLPAWYAQEGDGVWVDRVLSDDFLAVLDKIGFRVSPISEKEIGSLSDEEVMLWGVSPQTIHYFEELNQAHNISLRFSAWNDKLVYLNSRLFARDCLAEICHQHTYIEADIQPHVFHSLEEINQFLDQSAGRYVSKAPYSSSGRGLLWLPETGLTRTENQILHGTLKKQKSVSIEKVLDKKIDFAMEFLSDGMGHVVFVGYSLFQTNEKGGYLSNSLMAQTEIEKQLTDMIPQDQLMRVQESLQAILVRECASVYKGCIGVDMMIYVNNGGGCVLHPCLEVNMRYNMGYLSLCLYRNYISPSSSGYFYLDFGTTDGLVYQKHQQLTAQYPLVIDGGKVKSGYFPLCPIYQSSRFSAYALVQ